MAAGLQGLAQEVSAQELPQGAAKAAGGEHVIAFHFPFFLWRPSGEKNDLACSSSIDRAECDPVLPHQTAQRSM